jgi:hypothetical protein
VKPGVALQLKGQGGEGKTSFYLYLQAMIGRWHAAKTNDVTIMTGQFNGYWAALRLLILDEQHGTNDSRVLSAMNDAITSSEMTMNEKFMPRQKLTTICCFISCSTQIHAGERQQQERRWAAFEVKYNEQVCGDKYAFFKALELERDQGNGCAALLYLLRSRDISEFNPEREIVQNDVAWWDVYHSLRPVQRWWYECLKRGALFELSFGENDEIGEVFGTENASKGLFLISARQSCGDTCSDAEVWRVVKDGWNCASKPANHLPFHESVRGKYINVPSLEECRLKFQTRVKWNSSIWTSRTHFK